MIAVEQALGGDFAARNDLTQRVEETLFGITDAIGPVTRLQASIGNVEHDLAEFAQRPTART